MTIRQFNVDKVNDIDYDDEYRLIKLKPESLSNLKNNRLNVEIEKIQTKSLNLFKINEISNTVSYIDSNNIYDFVKPVKVKDEMIKRINSKSIRSIEEDINNDLKFEVSTDKEIDENLKFEVSTDKEIDENLKFEVPTKSEIIEKDINQLKINDDYKKQELNNTNNEAGLNSNLENYDFSIPSEDVKIIKEEDKKINNNNNIIKSNIVEENVYNINGSKEANETQELLDKYNQLINDAKTVIDAKKEIDKKLEEKKVDLKQAEINYTKEEDRREEIIKLYNALNDEQQRILLDKIRNYKDSINTTNTKIENYSKEINDKNRRTQELKMENDQNEAFYSFINDNSYDNEEDIKYIA